MPVYSISLTWLPYRIHLNCNGCWFRLLRLLPGPGKFWGSIQQPDLLPAEPKHLLGDGKRHTGRNPAVPVHGLRCRRCRHCRQAVPVPANGSAQPPRLNGDRGPGHLRGFLDGIWHRGRCCHPDGAPGIPCHGQRQL